MSKEFCYKQDAKKGSQEFMVCAVLHDFANYADFHIHSARQGVNSCYSFGTAEDFKGCFNSLCACIEGMKPYTYTDADGKEVEVQGVVFGEYEKVKLMNWFDTLAAYWNSDTSA